MRCEILAFVLLFSLADVALAEICAKAPAAINEKVSEYASSIRGYESCEYRTFATGDLDNDSVEDYAVRFTVEGPCYDDVVTTPGACGVNYEFYLLVYLGKSREVVGPVHVGGKGERQPESMMVKDGKLVMNVLSYGRNDAMCCPSIKGETAYKLDGLMLKETGL